MEVCVGAPRQDWYKGPLAPDIMHVKMVHRKQIAPKRIPPRAKLAPTKKQPLAYNAPSVAECVTEFKAFAKGGQPGVHALSRVWKSIMRHHSINDGFAKHVLLQAGMLLRNGELRLLHQPENPSP